VALHLLYNYKSCSVYVKVAMGYLPSPLEHSGYNRRSFHGSSRKVSLLSPNTESKIHKLTNTSFIRAPDCCRCCVLLTAPDAFEPSGQVGSKRPNF
jgi:hypothetical protein